jgi:hypothetical protein
MFTELFGVLVVGSRNIDCIRLREPAFLLKLLFVVIYYLFYYSFTVALVSACYLDDDGDNLKMKILLAIFVRCLDHRLKIAADEWCACPVFHLD